jgi:hypothetical protein
MVLITCWWWEKIKNLYKFKNLIEWDKEEVKFISLMNWELFSLLFKGEKIDWAYSIYVSKNEEKMKSQQNICFSMFD